MPLKCYYKPERKRKRTYTARDVGRIVWYAREDGVEEGLLIAYILLGFGARQVMCTFWAILDLLNVQFFVGAILGILNGLLTLMTGLKYLTARYRSIPTTVGRFLLLLLPEKYRSSVALVLVYIGAIEILLSTAVAYLTAIINNVTMLNLVRQACTADTKRFNFEVDPIDLGDLPSQTVRVLQDLEVLKRELEI